MEDTGISKIYKILQNISYYAKLWYNMNSALWEDERWKI